MASNTGTVPEKKGPSAMAPIYVPINIAWTVTVYLLLSIVLGTLIDYAGMLLGWWDKTHQLNVLASDIQYLGDNFTVSVFGKPPAEFALQIGSTVQQYMTFSDKIGYQDFFSMRVVKWIVVNVEPFWQNLVYSAMTVGVRLFIISMSLIFFVIVFIVAAVDGLVERELRKEAGGLEHAKVYHHAKTWVRRVLVVSPVFYLSYPETINPGFVILPAAAAFGLATFIAFSTFKKYL